MIKRAIVLAFFVASSSSHAQLAHAGWKHLDAQKSFSLKKQTRLKRPSAEGEYDDGLNYFIEMRAYPNDYVDWDSYQRAIAERERRERFHPTQGGANLQAIIWSFLGPINLPPVKQQFYGRFNVIGRVNAFAFPNQTPVTTGYLGAPSRSIRPTPASFTLGREISTARSRLAQWASRRVQMAAPPGHSKGMPNLREAQSAGYASYPRILT